MYEPYKALYIHIPFCKQRCRYCDFDTDAVAAADPRIEAYVDDLVLAIRRAGKAGDLAAIETIYLGGGTPSYIGTKYLSRILYTLGVSMSLEGVEFSMEANPESLTPELVKDAYALGVNRLSIGVQSLQDDILTLLGRVHNADTARAAIAMALERFDNVSVDMMCGIPTQDPELYADDLREVVSMGVKHISVYPLTIEQGTPFERMCESGELQELDEDTQAMMMQMSAGILDPVGMPRYEVASYAYEGYECKHNIAYWTGVPYLGIGRSAVTMKQNGKERIRIQDGEVVDTLDRRQVAAEDLMLGMRMTRGVSEQQVMDAALLLPTVQGVFEGLVQDYLCIHEDGRYKPTLGGWLNGNVLFGRIYELAP